MKRATLLHLSAHLLALVALLVASLGLYQVRTTPRLLVAAPRVGLRYGLPACTIYTAPTGQGTQSGNSAANAIAFGNSTVGRSSSLVPPQTICLEAGTYTLAHSFQPLQGTSSSAAVVYQPDGAATITFLWTAGQWPATSANNDYALIYFEGGSSGSPATAYTTWNCAQQMTLDGSNDGSDTTATTDAANGVYIKYTNDVTVEGCKIQYIASTGVTSEQSDDLTVTGNEIWLSGYYYNGGPSGISIHDALNYAGTTTTLHDYVTGNLIAGEVDANGTQTFSNSYNTDGVATCPSQGTNGDCNATDGNGIILDLMCTSGNVCGTGDETTGGPPILVANNLVYMNAGRCIEPNYVSNAYVVNNTCYQNALLANTSSNVNGEDQIGELVCNHCTDSFFIDNTAWAWTNTPTGVTHAGRATYEYLPCTTGCDAATDAGNHWSHNASYNGGTNDCQNWGSSLCVPADQLASANIAALQPAYSAPSVTSTGTTQWTSAPAPWTIGTEFTIASADPLAAAGVDPATVSGLPSGFGTAIDAVVATDLAGAARPNAVGWSIGAYQAPVPPTPTPTPTNTPGGNGRYRPFGPGRYRLVLATPTPR